MSWIWNKIKEERYIILFLAVLAMFRAMHEISKFRIDRSWLPSWGYPFGITSPPLDSYHVFGGLFVLVLIAGLRLKLRGEYSDLKRMAINRKDGKGDYVGLSEVEVERKVIMPVNPFWVTILIVLVEMYAVYFWVFDWFYHVIFMKPEFMEWKYIFFFIGN